MTNSATATHHGFPKQRRNQKKWYDPPKESKRIASERDTLERALAREARAIAGKPTRGGPTVTDPDRPYCKDDQTCCDFCCGN